MTQSTALASAISVKIEKSSDYKNIIESAKYEASLGLEQSTLEKYNKALSMCTEVCACGC